MLVKLGGDGVGFSPANGMIVLLNGDRTVVWMYMSVGEGVGLSRDVWTYRYSKVAVEYLKILRNVVW